MGPGSHDDMLEVAVWIGVVVVGLAVLAFLEVLRSNSFIGAHRGEIWMALPTVALCALASIAGAGAVLFFFRFFLGDVWQYALPVAIFTFVLLVLFPLEDALYHISVSPVNHSNTSRNPELEQLSGINKSIWKLY